MSAELIANIILPGLICIVMFGLGLSLTIEDFKKVFQFPKAFFVGFALHILVLPTVAFVLCKAFDLNPYFSIGIMLVAASPAGATSNLYSKIAKADVALSISLTAFNSVFTTLSLPIIAGIAISHFQQSGAAFSFPISRMLTLALLVVVPATLGMWILKVKPVLAGKMDRPIRIFSFVILFIVIVGGVAKESKILLESLRELGGATVLFAFLNMAIGYYGARLFGVSHYRAKSLIFECALHNASVSLFAALTILGSKEIAAPIVIYSVFMYLPLTVISIYFGKRDATPTIS